MSTNKFKVGDRYKVSDDSFTKEHGNIIEIASINGKTIGYKTISGTPGNYPWFQIGSIMDNDCLKPYLPNNKIVITTNGNTTTARLYDGKEVIKSATAKCNPSDEFNFEIGARLAMDRLLPSESPKPAEPPKPTYWSGKVVCVSSKSVGFTAGVVYSVINGALKDGDGDFRPFRNGDPFFEKFDDIKLTAYGEFIEYKGEQPC